MKTKKLMALLVATMLCVAMFGGTAVFAAATPASVSQTQSGRWVIEDASGNDVTSSYTVSNVSGTDYEIKDSAGTVVATFNTNGSQPWAATAVSTSAGAGGTVDPSAGIGKVGDHVDTQESIDKINQAVNLSADLNKANGLLSDSLKSLIVTIISALTWLILSAVGLFTAVDVFYLVVPALHTALEEGAEARGRTDKNGNPKPRFVSTDATRAYSEANETGKNVITIYLKKRIVAYIAVAVVVYMLLSGNLSAIIKLVLNLISGGLNTVDELSNGVTAVGP